MNKEGEVLVSIVTVTFNAAETLERTLKSVAAQKACDFEHVIIDGGSTDGTWEMVERYRQSNPSIPVNAVSERDKGLYDAMNKGLRLAKGKYVCFLNAGDKLHKQDTLYNICSIASKVDAGCIFGETDIVDNDGTFLYHRKKRTPEQLSWRSFRYGMLVCHQSFYARRDICEPYDLKYRFSADFDWCVKIMKKAEEINLPLVNTHEILTDYLEEGMTTRNHKVSLRERFAIMRKYYGLMTTLWMHIRFIFG